MGFGMYRALLVTGLLLSSAALDASAFEQTVDVPKVGGQSEAVGSAGETLGPPALSLPDAPVADEKSGPTITLPGLGTIGTLPRFDFGLELLYGEEDTPSVVDDDVENDVRIRGSVKHKF